MLILTFFIRANSGGALGHGQVRVLLPRVQPEPFLQRLGDRRRDGHAADQEHVVEVVDALVPRGGDRPPGDLHGALEQLGGELLELLAGQFELHDRAVEPDVVLAGSGGAQRLLELLGGGREVLHELLVAARVELRVLGW